MSETAECEECGTTEEVGEMGIGAISGLCLDCEIEVGALSDL